ncbi:MAG TPA: SRPBCC domain-containing protein [Thermoanaerobaculia bacterium]|nr:SRPBCC domain-containing protein [Thermoanaerobaculia bacterium]
MPASNERSSAAAADQAREFVITRLFDTSREVVFEAWTECEHLMRWWGPKGFKMLSCKNDVRPGGEFLYGMRAPDGSEIWGKWTYREVDRPERLVFIVSFADPAGNVTRHPSSPGWPLEMLSTVTFEEEGEKTKITVRWAPFNATDAERKTFEEGMESMRQGWGGTFDQFAGYLKEKRS